MGGACAEVDGEAAAQGVQAVGHAGEAGLGQDQRVDHRGRAEAGRLTRASSASRKPKSKGALWATSGPSPKNSSMASTISSNRGASPWSLVMPWTWVARSGCRAAGRSGRGIVCRWAGRPSVPRPRPRSRGRRSAGRGRWFRYRTGRTGSCGQGPDQARTAAHGMEFGEAGLHHHIGAAAFLRIRHLAGDDGSAWSPSVRVSDAGELHRARGGDDDDRVDPVRHRVSSSSGMSSTRAAAGAAGGGAELASARAPSGE